MTLLSLRSLDEEAKVVVVGVLLGYWSSAGELLCQLQDVHGTKKAKNNQPLQEFHKAIALALLDPDMYWPNHMKSKPVQNKNEPSVSGTKNSSKRGSDSVDTSGTRLIKKIRSSTITNNSLCPHTGALRNRLAINRGAHLPSHPNNNQMRCALHMWGNKT